MAGAVRHMERSHRSHNKSQQYGIFNKFHAKAYTKQNIKAARKTGMSPLQALGTFLKRAVTRTSSK